MRIGNGFDIHRLADRRKLILGGVEIPFERGLLGHSDADVATHAVCDALLGAAGLGDIGEHFPDTDPAYEGICSLELLKETASLLFRLEFDIVNLDLTLLAEAPKIGPYKEAMKEKLSSVLNINPDRINIKATTMEGLGSIGKKEAIGCFCTALLK